ncbi:diaminopimelate epimerase [Bifidobacterium choerinum]|uniref:diaminopimelate epimerase n=1 Tax=Bifidobacterium choerinum TaxID=35760 RepID=UPI003F92AF6A
MSIATTVYKTQGTGNDFVMFEDADGTYDPQPKEIAAICDRHFGIGADGLIRVTKPQYVGDISEEDLKACEDGGAEWFMDYRNADGSIAQMCGNGSRATALFIRTMHGIDGDEPLRLGTRAGVKTLTPMPDDDELGTHLFRVDMGVWKIGDVDAHIVTVADSDGSGKGTFVDMGNPHVVTVVEDAFSTLPVLEDLDLDEAPVVTPAIEEGQNVEFVRIDEIDDGEGRGEATMRVFERGCGETLSCGTGLCATAVVLHAKTGVNHWRITVRGGKVDVDVTGDDVMLTGPAAIVAKIEML